MSVDVWQPCAALLERGDADRFAALMAAPVAARASLAPLWAFNLEVARAPWVSSEPLIGEMRLQFWRDVLAEVGQGKPARAHEVAAPLAAVLRPVPELLEPLDRLVAARWWDLGRTPFDDDAALRDYIDATAGTLAWAGARLLGATEEHEIRRIGRAHGVAAWLEAIPALESRGAVPLVDGRPEAVAALAREALNDLNALRGRSFGAANAALRAGWRARGVLRRASTDPARVAMGDLAGSEAAKRAGLMWRALRGRW